MTPDKQELRITPDLITEINEGEVFVFGSNQAGKHGKGAARTALKWGAKWGQAEGLQGKTYGIPTKNASITKTLTIDVIGTYIYSFIDFAIQNPKLKFYVTEIGCGLAGYSPKDIAPLFKNAMSIKNIYLPLRFWHKLQQL